MNTSVHSHGLRDTNEFRRHWRPLAACFLGMGSALALNGFIVSTFAPYLMAEFGWSRSQWAMTGMVVILIVICMPVAGRLTDLFGVRRMAAIGVAVFPLSCVAITLMNGDIRMYLAIYIAQTVFCCTTTATIYTRLVAEKFVAWRGLALAICAGSPALVAALASPLLTALVRSHGWRAGYLAVAAFSAVAGAITLSLIPSSRTPVASTASIRAVRPMAMAAYRQLARLPVFWMLLLATLLVSLPHAMVATQLKLVTLAQGASDTTAAMLLSVFNVGVIGGRLLSGLALDRFSPYTVAAVFLGCPAAGMWLLASPFDSVPALALAILLVGLAFGGEGDIIAYLVVRIFGIGVFSTVMGLLTAAMAIASAGGALLLSVTLKQTNSFNTYLVLGAIGVAVGSLLFQLLARPNIRKPVVTLTGGLENA